MPTANQRISVLVTQAEKRAIAASSKNAGMSVGKFMRRAASSFHPSQAGELLEGMLDQVLKSTARASAAIDDAVAYVEGSNKKLAILEGKRKANRSESPRKGNRSHFRHARNLDQ